MEPALVFILFFVYNCFASPKSDIFGNNYYVDFYGLTISIFYNFNSLWHIFSCRSLSIH
jgi:hypothetical protein